MWTCSRCGETHEEQFANCWRCGSPRDGSGRSGNAASTASAQQSEPMAGATGPAAGPRRSRMAVAALVLGILSFLLFLIPALIGLALGIVALVQINRSRGRLWGQGFAIAGIIMSGLIILLTPVILAMLFPVFVRARESARWENCLVHTKNLAVATQMYITDYEACPGASGWCETLTEYVKNEDVFRCPSEPDLRCGYAYNAELDLAPISSVPDWSMTITQFESNRGWNAAGGWELLVPSPRHRGGDNYAFIDGHAAWLPRQPAQ